MEPSFEQADYLLVDQISYYFRDPERGEVVVFNYPEDPQKRHIKRIIGLPGEKIIIDEGRVFIEEEGEREKLREDYIMYFGNTEEKEIYLENGEYFVVGDNRPASLDSRSWGSLRSEYIIGRVFFQISPFDTFNTVKIPEY